MNFWTGLFTIGLIDQDKKIKQQQREIEEQERRLNNLKEQQERRLNDLQKKFDVNNNNNNNNNNNIDVDFKFFSNEISSTQNSQIIWKFIKNNDRKNFVAFDIATALGINIMLVNGYITNFQNKGLIYIEDRCGLKLIKLTDKGRKIEL